MPTEIADYHVGRRTRRGRLVEHEVVQIVTCVAAAELCSFLGCWDSVAVRRHLRRLRADGLLIGPRTGRLQAKVRGVGRCYVFRGRADDVPRLGRPRRRARLLRV